MVVFDKEVVKEGGAGGENHLEVGKIQIYKYKYTNTNTEI